MPLTLRPGKLEDATVCSAICYEAFKAIAAQHNFPPSYASPEVAVDRMVERLTHPGFYAVVAELDGRVVGSNFLDERSPIAGLGPITVDPTVQNRSIGRHLMQDVLDRVATQRRLGVRLVHAAYHTRALSLYAKMGFAVRARPRVPRGRPPDTHEPGILSGACRGVFAIGALLTLPRRLAVAWRIGWQLGHCTVTRRVDRPFRMG
jgi:predicted N-acetyltransferase YhbS